MCHPTLLALVLWLVFIVAGCAWEHVSADELQSIIEKNDVVVIAFVNPPDERPRYLEPEWSAAAAAEAHVPLISINCTASADACSSYGASSSTAVKLFIRDKDPSTYAGPRRASAILAWITRMQRPLVTELAIEHLADFKNADETVFIAYLDAGDESSKMAFAEAAAQFREEFTFGLTTDVAALASEKVIAPVVKCFKPLDGDTHDLAGFTDAGALEKFIREASRPLIGELLPHNHQRFLDSLRKMARGYYESLTMVTVDPLEFPGLPAELGLEPDVFPAGAVHQLARGRIYPYPAGRGITPGELQSWGLDVWQGRVKPWTPPGGVTTGHGDGPRGRIEATRKVSVRNLNIPGVNIRVGGRDEL